MPILNDNEVSPTDEVDVLRITLAKDKETNKKILGVYSDLTDEDVTNIIIALYDQRMEHISSFEKSIHDNMYGDTDLLKSELLEAGVKIMDPVNKN